MKEEVLFDLRAHQGTMLFNAVGLLALVILFFFIGIYVGVIALILYGYLVYRIMKRFYTGLTVYKDRLVVDYLKFTSLQSKTLYFKDIETLHSYCYNGANSFMQLTIFHEKRHTKVDLGNPSDERQSKLIKILVYLLASDIPVQFTSNRTKSEILQRLAALNLKAKIINRKFQYITYQLSLSSPRNIYLFRVEECFIAQDYGLLLTPGPSHHNLATGCLLKLKKPDGSEAIVTLKGISFEAPHGILIDPLPKEAVPIGTLVFKV